MPLPPEYDSFWRVRIVGDLHGSQTNNVLHFAQPIGQVTPDPFIDMAIALGTAVLACVVDTLLPAVTSDWNCLSVETTRLKPTLGDPIIVSPSGSGQGLRGATSVSFAAQGVNIRTGAGGRRGRGKMFLPPPGEADIEQSVTAAATMDLYAAFLACIAGKFIGENRTEGAHLVVYSRASDAGLGQFFNSAGLANSLQAKATLFRCGSRRKGIGV